MTYADFIQIVLANIPIDKGNMRRNGVEFFDTPYEYVAIYNVMQVPYIVFQEEGTRYFDGNKGFIRNRTVGMLNRVSMSETLGLPYDMSAINKNLADHQDKMLVELGVIQYV